MIGFVCLWNAIVPNVRWGRESPSWPTAHIWKSLGSRWTLSVAWGFWNCRKANPSRSSAGIRTLLAFWFRYRNTFPLIAFACLRGPAWPNKSYWWAYLAQVYSCIYTPRFANPLFYWNQMRWSSSYPILPPRTGGKGGRAAFAAQARKVTCGERDLAMLNTSIIFNPSFCFCLKIHICDCLRMEASCFGTTNLSPMTVACREY